MFFSTVHCVCYFFILHISIVPIFLSVSLFTSKITKKSTNQSKNNTYIYHTPSHALKRLVYHSQITRKLPYQFSTFYIHPNNCNPSHRFAIQNKLVLFLDYPVYDLIVRSTAYICYKPQLYKPFHPSTNLHPPTIPHLNQSICFNFYKIY